LGLLFAAFLFARVRAVSTQLEVGFGDTAGEPKNEHTVELIDKSHHRKTTHEINKTLLEIYEAVRLGADSLLIAEYRICLLFIAAF